MSTTISTEKMGSITGILNLQAYDKQNKLIWGKSSHNLIVASGYWAVAKALADGSDTHITKIAIGTNGNPAQESDSQITNSILIDIQRTEYPKSVSVRFHFEIGYADAVGMNIREFGLLTKSGKLFSRKVREVIEKNQNFRIVGMWDINICEANFQLPEDMSDFNQDYFDGGNAFTTLWDGIIDAGTAGAIWENIIDASTAEAVWEEFVTGGKF